MVILCLINVSTIAYVQDSVSWTLGFAIPGMAMALAVFLFWCGSTKYKVPFWAIQSNPGPLRHCLGICSTGGTRMRI